MAEPTESDTMDPELRERLTHVETRQETLEERADELKEGQKEILDKLDEKLDSKVTASELDDTEETLEERLERVDERSRMNEKDRLRARALLKLVTVAASLGVGIIGVSITAL